MLAIEKSNVTSLPNKKKTDIRSISLFSEVLKWVIKYSNAWYNMLYNLNKQGLNFKANV